MSKDDTRQTYSFFAITQEEITSIGFEDRIFSVIDEKKNETLTLDVYVDALSYTFFMKFPKAEVGKKLVFCCENIMDRVRRRTLYITGEDVKTASAFLQGIDREKLRKYYRYKTMVNLGCHIPENETEESFFEIMVEMVESLKTFYKKAADENKWVIYYYTVVPEKPTLFDRFLGKKLTNYYHDRANR